MSVFAFPNRYIIAMPKTYTKRKLQHFHTPGHPHALTFSCFRNREFLKFNRTRSYFRDALNNARIKHNFELWAYVLMPDHAHLIIFPNSENYSITGILFDIKFPVAKRTLTHVKKNNPGQLKFLMTNETHHPFRFWQAGGGYDRNIRDQEELLRMVEYMHFNPVRGGLVEEPTAWEWSSASAWLYDGDGPIKIDRGSCPV